MLHVPTVRAANIHKFNKAQNDAAALEVFGHRNDLMIIGSFFNHHVDFDVLKANLLGCGNSIEHISHWKIDIIHFLEDGVIQAIKADS